jgi:ABC-type lipoprotein export system ATPase subunit
MIRVRGMHKSYRTGKVVTPVLHGVDLDIADGEMVSIVGPSGSGKSTLLHAIGGLDRDYEGTIEVDGRELQALSDVELSRYRNEHVGFVFQSFALLNHQTCVENVALPALFARGPELLSSTQALARAREVLTRVDLSDKIDALPTTLSGGQRQRVAIARALFSRPRLMLCDEPTGNLDSVMGATIIDLFRRLNEEDGITVVIVTHDPKISASTQRTVRVQDGRVLEGEHDDEAPRAPAVRERTAKAELAGEPKTIVYTAIKLDDGSEPEAAAEPDPAAKPEAAAGAATETNTSPEPDAKPEPAAGAVSDTKPEAKLEPAVGAAAARPDIDDDAQTEPELARRPKA